MWEIDLEELVEIVTDAIAYIWGNFELVYHGYHVNLNVIFYFYFDSLWTYQYFSLESRGMITEIMEMV